jgi:alpha-ribazole phosphatase
VARLLLVRHGETKLQSSLRYWGRTDVALDESGRAQAGRLRDRLIKEKILSIYSSPLKRAEETARVIASGQAQGVIICPELREIDFGLIEGLSYAEIQERFPAVARAWASLSEDLAYPGGESLSQMEERVAAFASRLKQADPQGTLLVVAHAGILRSLICLLLGLEKKHRWNIRVDLASLSIIETYPEVNIVSLLNDTGHLRP